MLDTWCCPQAQISITAFLWESHSKYEKKHEDKTKYKLIYSTQGWIFVMTWAGCYKPEMIWWCSAMIHLFSRDYKQKRPLALLLLLASAGINWWACPWHKEKKHVKRRICRPGSLSSSTEYSCQQFWVQKAPTGFTSVLCCCCVIASDGNTHMVQTGNQVQILKPGFVCWGSLSVCKTSGSASSACLVLVSFLAWVTFMSYLEVEECPLWNSPL